MFPTTNAASENTGEYIEFQGEILPTNRMNYETQGFRPSAHADTVGANPSKDTEYSHILPTRGTNETNWMNVSKIPMEGGDTTSTRWIVAHTHETEREFQNRFPLPTKRSLNSDRVMPTLNVTSCRAAQEESQNVPIRWSNPSYYTEATLG